MQNSDPTSAYASEVWTSREAENKMLAIGAKNECKLSVLYVVKKDK